MGLYLYSSIKTASSKCTSTKVTDGIFDVKCRNFTSLLYSYLQVLSTWNIPRTASKSATAKHPMMLFWTSSSKALFGVFIQPTHRGVLLTSWHRHPHTPAVDVTTHMTLYHRNAASSADNCTPADKFPYSANELRAQQKDCRTGDAISQ